MIREAREINPDDERLTAFSAALHEEEISAQAPDGPHSMIIPRRSLKQIFMQDRG